MGAQRVSMTKESRCYPIFGEFDSWRKTRKFLQEHGVALPIIDWAPIYDGESDAFRTGS